MVPDCQSPTILVVEDDPRLAEVVCRVLSKSGYKVEWACNAAAAMRTLDPAPTVALVDLHLPDCNGVDLAGQLRARYPRLPMVLMTGCPSRLRKRPDVARYFRQELQKPLELQQLKEAISGALDEDAHAVENAPCAS
jgi:two-component system OmpR family response regulator/two-component system response regulator MprA